MVLYQNQIIQWNGLIAKAIAYDENLYPGGSKLFILTNWDFNLLLDISSTINWMKLTMDKAVNGLWTRVFCMISTKKNKLLYMYMYTSQYPVVHM